MTSHIDVVRESQAPRYGVDDGIRQIATVARQTVLDRLKHHGEQRLFVITGPAGYGKTTLMRQYADYRQSQGDTVAWLRVETRFADPAEFLRMLGQAAVEMTGWQPSGKKRRPPDKLSLHELADILRESGVSGVIFLDNYELARDPGLEMLLSQLVRLLPDNLQLCIGTRSLSAPRLAALRLDAQTLIIDEEDLRFQPSETREFFAEFPDLPPGEIDQIHESTDGWPVALQSFRLCLRRGRKHRSAAYAGGGFTPELLDFLTSEVFDNLEPAMQDKLLALSVPEALNASLVEHILNVDDGESLLREIEYAGLFLTSIDLDGHWFRFHNLFRQFLLNRLTSITAPGETQERQRQIAQWHADKGQLEQAIQHYMDAGDNARAAELLNGMVAHFLAAERLGLIEHYADRLPRDELLRHEQLTSAAIIAFSFRRAFDKARSLLEQARQHNGPNTGQHDFAEVFLFAAEDRMQELGELASSLAEKLDGEGFKHAICLNSRGIWLYARNEFEAARNILVQARSIHDEAGSLFGQAYQEAIHSMVLSGQGRVNDAVLALATALRRTEREAATSASAGSVLAAYLADGLYEQNRIQEAERLITDYGQFAEQQAIVDPLAVMLLTQARIARLRDNSRLAEDTLERLIYFGHRHKLSRLVSYGNAELLRYATLDGDLERAGRRMEMLDDQRGDDSEAELLFHAGETEYVTVTRCRWLIAAGQYAEARGILQREIRLAHGQRRHRRELKLLLLLASGQYTQHNKSMAFRSALRALEIAAPQRFVRSFLDEGPAMVRMLRELRESLPELPPNVEPDLVMRHLDRLLREAGEAVTRSGSDTQADERPDAELLEKLTRRELDLLRQLSRGLSNGELAERLCVSTNTIKWHLRNIFEKLQIRNRVQAVAVARSLGLID